MRVIIRFSVDGEKNSALRNKINTVLNNAGFRLRKHTATYEHKNLQTIDLGRLLRAVWNKAYHLTRVPDKSITSGCTRIVKPLLVAGRC